VKGEGKKHSDHSDNDSEDTVYDKPTLGQRQRCPGMTGARGGTKTDAGKGEAVDPSTPQKKRQTVSHKTKAGEGSGKKEMDATLPPFKKSRFGSRGRRGKGSRSRERISERKGKLPFRGDLSLIFAKGRRREVPTRR